MFRPLVAIPVTGLLLALHCSCQVYDPSADPYMNLESWINYHQSSYFISHTPADWGGAVEACRAMGAHLADIADFQEGEFVRTLAINRGQSAWVGASNTEKGPKGQGHWTWQFTGQDVVLELFYLTGDQDHGQAGSQCLQISKKKGYLFSIVDCSMTTALYVCEKSAYWSNP